MSVGFPPQSIYPTGIDTDATLYLVYNTTESVLTASNAAWSEEILLKPVEAGMPEIWASNGFATIEGELLYYDAVQKDSNGKVYKLKNCLRGIDGRKPQSNPAGTWIRGFVVADHHNQIVSAIANIENFVGITESEDEETLDWRIRNLQEEPIVFDDFACPDVEFTFNILSSDQNSGVVAQFQVNVQGNFGNFVIQFGDGTSTTSNSGTHTYPPNSKIDPVVIVSNDNCQVVQTPIERSSTEEPQVKKKVPPFFVPVPLTPEIPLFNFPSQQFPSIDIAIPPIVFPCIDLNPIAAGISAIVSLTVPAIQIPSIIMISPAIPSVISVDGSLGNILVPSFISFAGIPSFSPIQFGPAPSFSPVTFGPAPSFGVISFGPTPAAFGPIGFGPTPTIPSSINFGPAPSFSPIAFGPNPLPSTITFGPNPLPTTIEFGTAPTFGPIGFGPSPLPTTIDFGSAPSFGPIGFGSAPSFGPIGFGTAPSFGPIAFGPAPTFGPIGFGTAPTFGPIGFGPNPLPTTIDFGSAPSFGPIAFGPAPSFGPVGFGPAPSFGPIGFGTAPTIVSTITFGPAPSFGPIGFGPVPAIASIINFGPAPTFDPVGFGPAPSFGIINFGPAPSFGIIDFGPAPIVSVAWGTPPTVTCTCTVTCPSSNLAMNNRNMAKSNSAFGFDSLADPGFENIELQYDMIGFPSEITIAAPDIPPIEVKHDLPSSISLHVPEIKDIKIIGPEVPLPTEIRIIPPDMDKLINIVSFQMPSEIKLDVSSLPTSISVVFPKELPMISFDVSTMPESIKVVGIPEVIKIEHSIPSMIMLEAPEGLKVPLVFEGPPLSAELKIDWNLDKLKSSAISGSIGTFAIVPVDCS